MTPLLSETAYAREGREAVPATSPPRRLRYVYASEIRALCHANGKRCSREFLRWLDRRVEHIVKTEAANIGSRLTLSGLEAELRRRANGKRS